MEQGLIVGFLVGFAFAVAGGITHYYLLYRRLRNHYEESLVNATEALEEAAIFIDGLSDKLRNGEIQVVQHFAGDFRAENVEKFLVESSGNGISVPEMRERMGYPPL